MISTIYKLSGTSLLALSLAILPFTSPGQAQVNPEPGVIVESEDDGFDWGWLGLLGLLGLAGLAGKNKQTHYETRTTTEPTTTTEPFPEAPSRRSNL